MLLPRPSLRALATLVLGVALVAGGCIGTSPSGSPQPLPTGEAAPAERPVIIDADMDISDLAAIAVLLRDPALDIRAIAIDGTGLVHCAGGMAVTGYLLEEFGSPDIPFGCGREDPGPDGHEFPPEWRAVADDAYGMEFLPRPSVGLPDDAATVLAEAIDGSPSAPTIVALGPWTNLEDAFAADPSLPSRVAGIHAMIGTIDAPGNVYLDGLDGDDPLEWNAYADPSSVAAVLATDVPIDIVPLDATDDVPVPADLPDRLAEDPAAAGANLVYELLLRHPDRLLADQGQQLWDELAALAVSQPELVTWSDADVIAGEDGRLVRDDVGRPVRYASAADQAATEAALLDALRRGGPRATPFQLAGTIEITWEGTTCGGTIDPAGAPTAGIHRLRYTGQAGTASGGLLAGVDAGHTWADLEAFLRDLDVEAEQEAPPWVLTGGQVVDEAGTGAPVEGTGTVESGGTYGPVCVSGTWPDLTYVPGEPFSD